MKEYIQSFFERFSYPTESREVLLKAYERLSQREEFQLFLQEYAKKGVESDVQGMTAAVKTLGEEVGVHRYTATTLLFVCWSKSLLEFYRQKGISEEVWKTSMYDLLRSTKIKRNTPSATGRSKSRTLSLSLT